MKILMLNYECPPLGGGAGRIAYNIAYHLSLKNNFVIYLTTWYRGLQETEIVNENFKIIRLKSFRKHLHKSNPFEMFHWIVKSILFLRKNKNLNKDIEHCIANFALPGGVVAYYLKKKNKIHYSIISHGQDIPWYYKKQMFFYHIFFYLIIKLICKNSDNLFVQSQHMYKNAVNFVGQKDKQKVKIINNGVSFPTSFDYQKRKKQPLTIIFVGRVVKQKRPDLFLKALIALRNMQIQYHAYIIGDGVYCKKLSREIVKNNLNHVKIIGWISHDEVWKYYEMAHVLVLPSEAEGMSLTILEAKTAGLYIITTDVSGNKEILSGYKYCVLLNELSFKKIADYIQLYYFDYYLKKDFPTKEHCLKDNERFSWNFIAQQYLYIINQNNQ